MFYAVNIGDLEVCKLMVAGAMPASTPWGSMAHNGSQWVAGGTGPNMAYSSDGASWSAGTGAYTGFSWRRLVWFPDVSRWFVYNNFDNKAMWSSDGIAWTQTGHNGPSPNTFNPPLLIGALLYTASTLATTSIYTSPDGTGWTERGSVMPQSNGWVDFATNGTTSVAVPGVVSTASYVASISNASLPGGVWTQRNVPVTASWGSVIWNSRIFLALGETGNCIKSSDGETWSAVTIPTTISDPTTKTIAGYGRPCSTSNGNIYVPITNVAGPDQTTKYLATRDDGVTWQECALATTNDRWQFMATDGTRVACAGSWGDAGVGSTRLNYSS